VDASSGI